MTSDPIAALAKEANVDDTFVERLASAGAIPRESTGYGAREVRRVRLLRAWEDAGLPAELVMRLVEGGQLSLSFLDTPVIAGADRLASTYRDLAIEENVPLTLIQGLHQAIGFDRPRPDEPARADDSTMIGVARLLMGIGGSEAGVLRLFRVYADALRRIAQAEAELFEAEIESRLRQAGMTERQLLEFGNDAGDRIVSLLEGTLVAIYRRHREHVWIAHSTNHAETALDQAGLHPRAPREDTICFVDLTGYTHLTEERGDELAARFAAELAALVEDVSSRWHGRPIRWLGDGGIFHFRDPIDAAHAALEMVDGVIDAGLPPTHIGIHAGAVIFQDGDVYGRTVNMAARIAAQAEGGEVLASEHAASVATGGDVEFDPVRTVELKGIADPVTLYRARRAGAELSDDRP